MRPADRHGFTLTEVVAVLAVVALAAGLVLARVPGASALRLEEAGRHVAERLSDARERAILLGRPVRIDPSDRLPPAVRVESVDVGGAPALHGIELAPDGDALPLRVTLAGDGHARLDILLPPGFHRARVLR